MTMASALANTSFCSTARATLTAMVFRAIWTPERHFHAFGGPYPNPSVTGAAVAAITSNLDIRAGSCVLPLHHRRAWSKNGR